jgi:ureidoglycolate lyase
MIELRLQPLTKTAFAPFGDVVEMEGANHFTINQGFAERFDDLANIDVSDEGGVVKVSLFTAKLRPRPIVINLMERHPLGSQLFYPLQDRPWLVLVCADPHDTTTYQAFRATGQQGVNYAKNIWHFPLLALEEGNRFVIVDRKGPGNNLEEVMLQKQMNLMHSRNLNCDDPFEAFTEWHGEADGKAFKDL